MNLKNNTVLITGGSSGLGLELAKTLLEKKCKVLICGRSADKLEEARKLLGDVHIFQCDLSEKSERERLFNWVSEYHPECNILVNNAAIVHRTQFASDDCMVEKAEEEIQVNLIAPIVLAKMFLPLMSKNVNPAIINITSGLVYAPKYAYPIYNSTKTALHAFTQVLRHQIKESPVKVVEVLMPVVDTPWHNGNVPTRAISTGEAIKEMVLKLEKGEDEIKVGKVGMLYVLSRIAPSLALRIINRS